MYRLFSDFPLGLPGLGLLLLRVALAGFLLIEGVTRTTDTSALSTEGIVRGPAPIVLAIPVALGFLTPIVHVIVALVESGSLLVSLGPFTNGGWQIAGLKVAIALALAMIGPGGYSVDSRLFGRRQIVIRPRLANTRHPVSSSTRK